MANLTQEQKEAYLADPNRCPYCKSDDIDGSKIKSDDDYAWMDVSCNGCGKSWQDIYQLADVQEVNADG